MSSHFFQRHSALALLSVCLCSNLVQAKTISQSPCPTIVLTKSPQFIAQDGWNSVALYGLNDGKPIRKFPARARINRIEATADEERLLIACDNGEIGVWNIATGDKLCWHSSSRSGLGYIYGASFSWDGKSLVACNHRDFAVVFDALSGKQVGKVSFPPKETNIMSATLSPDGSKGALVDLGERLFTFDTNTGLMKDTGLKGAWPVRYSADGKYIALRSSNSGIDEQLRVVAVKDLAKKDVGQFGHIGHIKPTADGSFLVCARAGEGLTVGVEYHPDSGEPKKVWKFPAADAENRTDFDPKQMIGASTNFLLVTRLIDLRTGKPRMTIDNSANYRENILTYTSMDLPWLGERDWLVAIGIGVMIVWTGCIVVYFRRRRRIKTPPPDAAAPGR